MKRKLKPQFPGDQGLRYKFVFTTTPPPGEKDPSKPRHPSAQRFHDLLAEIGKLHDLKQQDYGRDDDPFANVRSAERWGVSGWVYAMLRVQEKVVRLQTMQRKGRLVNESAQDSFRDLAVYALIALILFEEAQEQSSNKGPDTILGQYFDFQNFSNFAKSMKLSPKLKKALKGLKHEQSNRGSKKATRLRP